MSLYCHRCHGELSPKTGGRSDDDDAELFCPRCGAPQLMLPEYLRVEPFAGPGVEEGSLSTGTLPPPRVRGGRQVNWRAALTAGASVAVTAALLTVVGLKLSGVALLGVIWVLSGAAIAVGIYRKRSAQTGISAQVGLRVGTATGLLMLAAMGLAGAATGVALRFGAHGLERFDEQSAEQARQMQSWMVNFMAREGQDKATQDQYIAMMNSPRMTAPEVKAGGALAQLGFQGLMIVLISAGGGAFAGMLQGRREAMGPGRDKV